MIRREVARIDLDAVREAADARLVGRQHRLDELLRRPARTSAKFARMLPLRSSSITTVIGCRSLANERQVLAHRPLSRIEKASREQVGHEPAVVRR